MAVWTVWIILIIAGYLFGSIPLSYLVARSRGIDLRKDGTGQTGGGNLWRTVSRKLGLAIGVLDFLKGMLMLWIASLCGLDAGQQLVVGLATVVGHNWPVFLRFHGGRGIATLLGIAILLPVINDISPWPSVVCIGAVVFVTIVFRSSPLPVLIGVASLPLTSWLWGADKAIVMAYLVIFLVVVAKRLTAQPATEARRIGMWRLMLNRLLFDRDIADRNIWVHRKHSAKKEKKK